MERTLNLNADDPFSEKELNRPAKPSKIKAPAKTPEAICRRMFQQLMNRFRMSMEYLNDGDRCEQALVSASAVIYITKKALRTVRSDIYPF